MAKLFNLAQMTTATAGTGTITLGSAVAPFITFAAAGVQNNDVVAYSIIDGANSEMGYGTYSAAGPTLTRNLRKSSTGALLNLSGSAIVRLTPGREDIVNPDGSIAFVANLDMGSNRIINVSDPTGTQDAATKNYVDVAISGVTGSGSGHNPVTLGIANGLVLSNQVLSLDLASSTTTGSVSAADWMTFNNKQAALGFTPENVANKDIDAALASNSDTKYPSQKAVKTYVDAGLATGTHAPVTLGIANGLSLSGQQLSLGFSSGTSSGALSGSDWQLFNSKQAALGFTPENIANKTQLVRSSGTSSTLYPSESAVSSFVSTAISSIPSASGNIGSFLLSGGGVTWVTGYQFRVSAAQYYIQGVLYSSAEQLITLTSSDATYDRIDVIVVNTSGQVDKVTGVANASPSEPDIDPATQLQLAFIIVYAASSSPIIQSQTIYSEDAGSPTEWNWSSTGSTWNLASTNNPFAGTKDIEATALGANAYAQGMATSTVNLGIYTQLNFYVRSKATWNAGRGIYVAWYSNGVRKGNNVFLAHGFFNFNSDNTTDYQLISIPISQFAVPNGTTVNQLRFTRVGGAVGFYLDEIVVTDSGLTSTPVGLTQEQADARYVLKRDFATWFNVRDYGAIGDGVVDDTSAVNLAIAALNIVTKGVLYFPAGAYKCTAGLTAITADCAIIGDVMSSHDGAQIGSKVICTSATAILFDMNTRTGLFRDLTIQNTSGTTPSAGSGVHVYHSSGNAKVDFERVEIMAFYTCLDVQAGVGWTLNNTVITDPVLYGVRIRNTWNGDAGDWAIDNCVVNSPNRNATAGIRIESSGGGKISNTKIIGATYKFANGIDLNSNATTGILLINNVSVESVSGHGMSFATSGGSWESITIVGCQFGLWSNNTGNAINFNAGVLGQLGYIAIVGCIFQGGTAAYAISLTNIQDVRVIGCVNKSFGAMLTTSGCTGVWNGPLSAPGTYTDKAITRWNGTDGTSTQNSGITIPDGASGILSGTNTGDQNLFKSIVVSGQSTIFADTPTKALTFAGTGGIVVNTATGTATVTIDGSGISGTTNTQVSVNGFLVYDDSVFKVTGSAISFDSNLSVGVTGSVAFVSSSSGGISRSGATTDAHLAIWNGSSTDSIKDGGTIPAGTALSNSDISPTTTNITAAVNTRYYANISGLTASRDFILPTGTIGDQVELYMTTGNATYEFIIKGTTAVTINNGSAATEWSRLFIGGESVKFVLQSPTNWIITTDGRIPCLGVLELSGNDTTNTGGVDTAPTWDTKVIDRGNIGDTTNFRFNVRRTGYYAASASWISVGSVTSYAWNRIYLNSTAFSGAYSGSINNGALCLENPQKEVLAATGDYIKFFYQTNNANTGAGFDPRTWFKVLEIL